MSDLRPGDAAPDFTLPDAEGRKVSLREFRGRTVVLYFYPKDDTPGCTQEACDFRDHSREFSRLQAVILGISADSADSHRNFIRKYDLGRYGVPFFLLSDEEHRVLAAYGVWRKKNSPAGSRLGTVRTTMVIGGDGRIRKIYPQVKVAGHVAAVLRDLQSEVAA